MTEIFSFYNYHLGFSFTAYEVTGHNQPEEPMAFLNLPWDRCWCFSTVRAGSIASAIYAVIIALLRIAASIVEEFLVSAQHKGNMTMLVMEEHSVERAFGYIELAMAVLLLTAGICLLIGIFKHKSILLVPFIILFGFICIIEALCVMLGLLALILLPSLGVVVMLSILLLSLFVDGSCTLCVLSHYMNLRAGRESMRAIYRSQGERLGDADDEEAAALPSKSAVPTDSSMRFTTTSDVPVSSFEDAPPPYRDV